MKTEKWKTLSNAEIQHTWKCPGKTCKKVKVQVSPDWYEINGTPICPNCGDDLEYKYTEIMNK
jgi:hypothetical protein